MRTRTTILFGLLWAARFGGAAEAGERTIYAFRPWSTPGTGTNPGGTLLRDASGAFYGAAWLGGAYYHGTIYKLTPPAPDGNGNWMLSVIYTFKGGEDGSLPNAGLAMDSAGAIYGTTSGGGSWMNQGLVFKLTPPAAGTGEWRKTNLHYFYYYRWGTNTDDGSNPSGGLVMDRSGALYGTTDLGGAAGGATGYGTVFKLTPLDGARTRWQESVIYRFQGGADGQNPMDRLTLDANGGIYGTTLYGGGGPCYSGCGIVFRLNPPAAGQTAWTKTTLYTFTGQRDGGAPQGKLLLGASGSLYGSTYKGGTGGCRDGLGNPIGCGVVYKLTPPSAVEPRWTYIVLHDFQGGDGAFPQGGVITDGTGALIGTASSGAASQYGVPASGLVFRLTPPAAGQRGWTQSVLHTFNVSTSGSTPLGELVRSPDGRLYGVAHGGGPGLGGTIYEITP